jgi:hypothetical protein
MLTENTPQQEVVIACDPNAVPVEKRARWIEVGTQVYAAVQEVRELPDGYACRLPGDAAMLLTAAEYVSLDRLCCAFVRWSLVLEPNGGALWLHLTGAAGVKDYARQTLETTHLLNEEVAKAAGFSVSSRAAWIHPEDPTLRLG